MICCMFAANMLTMMRKEWNQEEVADFMRRKSIASKKYEKTRKGFLMRAHRNMRSRVLGIQKQKHHLYSHIDSVISREDFYAWSLSDPAYNALFDAWAAAGYDRKLTPSVDRIDPKKGYTADNMEWVTHSENSRRASIWRTKLTKDVVARIRAVWSPEKFMRGEINKAALAREVGVSYTVMIKAFDDEYVKRKGLI